ncbi:MAG: PHP domain-containing protein [Enterocloster asparagiformis]|nr:PHP domain-containing protein [Enterocloster asparagiformis]
MNSLLIACEAALSRLNFKFPYSIKEWMKLGMLMENYHKHTAWSNLTVPDSATSVEEFIDYSKSFNCKCMFSTEHGFQGEWLYVYNKCKEKNISFRYGAEVYWVKDRKAVEYENYIDKNGKEHTREKRDNTNCHMVLVARNYTGVRKLNYIISMAAEDGYYYRPRIDLELLFTLSPEDVYVTSACIAGWKYEDAEEIWLKIWEHFGDSFFLEYQCHITTPQKELNRRIYEFSKKYGIQTIIGLDTHYLNDEDCIKRDNLLQRKDVKYDDECGWYMDFPNGKEVYRRMKQQCVLSDDEIVYAMMNTQVFIDGCRDFEINTNFKIPILPEYQSLSYKERCSILEKNLMDAYAKEPTHSTERLEGIKYELDEIIGSGTADYFLTNPKIVNTAITPKYGGVLTTTSRGSASSYYCSKLLGFTTMDRFTAEAPIYPERFMTKERILSSHQMPDIDLNISAQEPFVSASKDILGAHSCYPLLAVAKLGEKSGFKLYADIKGVEPSIANEISKCIDQYNEALKQVEDEEDKKLIFIEDFIKDKQLLQVFEESKPYQGIVEQGRVHACGFLLFNGDNKDRDLIGYGDIRYEIGLIRCHSESTGKSVVVACVEGGLLDYYGFVKLDFLIVDCVSIISNLYTNLGMKVPTTDELREMVKDDPLTWDLYKRGITCCLNQCERASTTKKVMRFSPQNVRELCAFVAAIRPGFKSLLDGFLERKEYSCGEPAIDQLLEDSFHYMLYQEAVMRVFSYLGILMKDSYDTIKKISKKKLKGEALKKVENNMRNHWLQNIGNLNNFDAIFQVIKDSARYGFNAPHALAMALDSLYEAWPKAHHTSVFYEVVLNYYQAKKDKDKVADLQKEAMDFFGYRMGEYKYGNDNSRFVVDDNLKVIYPNLGSIKGIGENVMHDINNIYKSGLDDFVDIRHAIKGTQINASVFKSLVKIGYFSKYGSIKKLLTILKIYDKWSGSNGNGLKTISKSKLDELNLGDVDISQFATDVTKSGKISDKQYTNLDWIGLVKELAKRVPNEEYGVGTIVKFQLDVLGYVDYVNADLDPRYCLITELNTTYSPKFIGYCLATGKKKEFKIHKKLDRRNKSIRVAYDRVPVEDGDIIYINAHKKEPRQKKVNDTWVAMEGVFDTWINDYTKVQLG